MNTRIIRLCALASCLHVPILAAAQGLNAETEMGSDGHGESFFSQYVNYDLAKVNFLSRYFWVNGVLERGELALGPTFTWAGGQNALKFQFGGTTDREVMTGATLAMKVAGRDVLYIVDGKIGTVDGNVSTLFQKLFVSLDASGAWQFRVEDLLVGESHGFLRIGVELRLKPAQRSHFFVAPFYDPVDDKGLALQAGFRFP